MTDYFDSRQTTTGFSAKSGSECVVIFSSLGACRWRFPGLGSKFDELTRSCQRPHELSVVSPLVMEASLPPSRWLRWWLNSACAQAPWLSWVARCTRRTSGISTAFVPLVYGNHPQTPNLATLLPHEDPQVSHLGVNLKEFWVAISALVPHHQTLSRKPVPGSDGRERRRALRPRRSSGAPGWPGNRGTSPRLCWFSLFLRKGFAYMAVVVKTNGVPFWGGCTTHFRTNFSGDWDVHWGLTDFDFDNHTHIPRVGKGTKADGQASSGSAVNGFRAPILFYP